MKRIWIDIINPSHALFFNALYPNLTQYEKIITIRERAETVELVKLFGIQGEVIGTDYRNPLKKIANMVLRTLELEIKVPSFDYAISFENGMSVMVTKFRGKKSILFCDNDLKFLQKKFLFQDLETKIKSMASFIVIPSACEEIFSEHINEDRIISYNGYKEDIYIADFKPDPCFKDKMPFEDFIVIRPEALGSFYVKENRSIVPEILNICNLNNINVIFLPREKEDFALLNGHDAFIPGNAFNGLDLCYHSSAVLTGSGTMAREAACMGVPSVSFFPGNILLSVDRKLVSQGKILHSRDPKEIMNYVLNKIKDKREIKIERSVAVKKQCLEIINNILS